MAQRIQRFWTFSLALALGICPLLVWWASTTLWVSSTVRTAVAQSQTVDWPNFAYYHEFYGPNGYTDPSLQQNLNLGMMNGLTFSPPVVSDVPRVTRPFNSGLMLRMPGAATPAALSAETIDQNRSAFEAIAASTPRNKALWLLMPEWDQSGGAWVSLGRPRYDTLSRASAHERFLNYYRANYSNLLGLLATPSSLRNHLLTAVTVYAPSVYDAYEMGVDVQLLERGLDELGDHSTGIPFLRGAANQFNRVWGVDISTWRTSTNSATSFAANGTLRGGWSPSYLRRLSYASYLSGAKLILNEASTYRYPDGKLNPFGAMVQEFADFALRRHPDLGQPTVTTALLINPDSGYEPKHGIYDQKSAVWYRDIPFSGGDSMSDQFFRLAYPNHWLHGLTPGAPFANSAGVPNTTQFQSYLASGQDPRPYEPMPFTRWGDRVDVLTTRTNYAALQRYRTIILMGDLNLIPPLREALSSWVNAGGTLVMNSTQATREDQNLTGLSFDPSQQRSSRFSRWLPDDVGRAESLFTYAVVQANGARVLAASDSGDPLITSRALGAGQVIFTTPTYFLSQSKDSILALGIQFYDWLFDHDAPARVTGPPIAYIVNSSARKTVVALFNNTATEWKGQINVPLRGAVEAVRDYVADKDLSYSVAAELATIDTTVSPFDLRVIAVEQIVPAATEEIESLNNKSRAASKHEIRLLKK